MKKEEFHTPEDPLKKAQDEAKESYDKYVRAAAEFENYKKRAAKEHAELIRHTQEVLMKELVKVLDDFDRVIDHLPAEESPAIKGLIEGIEFVHRDFSNILKKSGVKEIETAGKKFDPHFHEAISQTASNEHEEGAIVTCHRKGYLFHDKLLRPASVTVAKEKTAGKTDEE